MTTASVEYYEAGGGRWNWIFRITGRMVAHGPMLGYSRRRQAVRGFQRFVVRAAAGTFRVVGLEP